MPFKRYISKITPRLVNIKVYLLIFLSLIFSVFLLVILPNNNTTYHASYSVVPGLISLALSFLTITLVVYGFRHTKKIFHLTHTYETLDEITALFKDKISPAFHKLVYTTLDSNRVLLFYIKGVESDEIEEESKLILSKLETIRTDIVDSILTIQFNLEKINSYDKEASEIISRNLKPLVKEMRDYYQFVTQLCDIYDKGKNVTFTQKDALKFTMKHPNILSFENGYIKFIPFDLHVDYLNYRCKTPLSKCYSELSER